MTEYIEREEIRRAYEKLTRSYVNGNPYIADWRFDEMIEKLPAADVAPARHGCWERVIPSKSAAKWSTRVSCSNCHSAGYAHHKYCPNCGADMRGGNDE